VLESISRVMVDVVDERHQNVARQLRRLMATYREASDLITIGAYVAGSNPEIDEAVQRMPAINEFLRQGLAEASSFETIVERMEALLG